MPPTSFDKDLQTRTERFGELASGRWQVYKLTDLAADMPEPSTWHEGIFSTVGAEIAWLILFPAGPTSCKVSTYRRVGVVANDTEVVAPEWVMDDQETLTQSGVVFQYNLGDRTAVRIHDIVAPAGTFRVLYKRVSRRA